MQNNSTFQSQSSWTHPTRSYYNSEDSRPPTPLHISPPLSYLRRSMDHEDENTEFSINSDSSSSTPSASSSYEFCPPATGHHFTTSVRRREGVMRLESILNDTSVNPSYALWTSAEKPQVAPHNEGYTLPTVEDARDVSLVTERASSEGAESEVNSNNGRPTTSKKIHRCSECGKSFPRPSGLKTHMSIHTKEKPFTCIHPGCGRTFSVASNARRHMRLHGIGLESDSSSPEMMSPIKVDFEQPIVIDSPMSGLLGNDGPRRLKWSAARVKTGL